MSRERGTTLVDLMIGLTISGIVMAAGVSVVVGNRRFYTGMADVASAMSTLNHMHVALGAELLPVNASAGDLIHAGTDSIQIRFFTGVYTMCARTLSPITFTIRRLSHAGAIQQSDSVMVYSRGSTAEITDDLWEHVKISAIAAGTCADGRPGRRLTIQGLTVAEAEDVPPGAPLRPFTKAAYSFVERSNGWYLVRNDRDRQNFPIAGPFLPPSNETPGLEFRYLDANGDATVVESEVVKVEVVAIATRSVSRTRDEAPRTVTRTLPFTFRNN